MAHHPKAIAAFNLCFHKALAFSSLQLALTEKNSAAILNLTDADKNYKIELLRGSSLHYKVNNTG